LLREAGAARWFIAGAVALALLSAASTVAIAWYLSSFISEVFINNEQSSEHSAILFWLLVFGVVKALSIWLQEFLSARSAASVKTELRQKFYLSVINLGENYKNTAGVAYLNSLAVSGLDALDIYFSKYLPQLIFTAIVSPILIAVIFSVDSLSGITILITMPLIPIFMILIGWSTQKIQNQQLDVVTKLSAHLLEAVRGLTTLKIFRRAQRQTSVIAEVSENHRKTTMRVLRVSFLSGFALEMLASLSVALIAVSIGLRLIDGSIGLFAGLFVLILAPEAFSPLRQVGANFHAAAEGVVASEKVLDVIQLSKSTNEIFQSEWSFDAGEITLISGESGVGKSTRLRAHIRTRDRNSVAWMPQEQILWQGRVQENIVGPGESVDHAILSRAMELAALEDLAVNQEVGEDGKQISGGQAQRVCLARLFYRAISKQSTELYLDEPTSALDETRTKLIINSLREFAAMGCQVVVISHDVRIQQAATSRIEVTHV
jgi:ATP-binding cassette subfamily C protein CydD